MKLIIAFLIGFLTTGVVVVQARNFSDQGQTCHCVTDTHGNTICQCW